jgi:hypothetical protein
LAEDRGNAQAPAITAVSITFLKFIVEYLLFELHILAYIKIMPSLTTYTGFSVNSKQ